MSVPFTYHRHFVDNPEVAFERLQRELDWKRVREVRSEYYCNDFPDPYTYGSGRGRMAYDPQPWHSVILEIRKKLEKLVGKTFEVCFLNRYLSFKDHLGWHSDDSPEMDDARPIVTISLGAEREIWFRAKDKPETVTKLLLENGSCCIMHPGMQETHQHRIPKADHPCGERISLTFRGYLINPTPEKQEQLR